MKRVKYNEFNHLVLPVIHIDANYNFNNLPEIVQQGIEDFLSENSNSEDMNGCKLGKKLNYMGIKNINGYETFMEWSYLALNYDLVVSVLENVRLSNIDIKIDYNLYKNNKIKYNEFINKYF